MKGTFKADCPYCNTKQAGFVMAYECRGTFHLASPNEPWSREPPKWMTFAKCPVCSHGIISFIDTGGGLPPSAVLAPDERGFAYIRVQIPSAPNHSAPKFTPEAVSRFYSQGAANLPQHPDAAGAMFRKALERAVSHAFPSITGKLFDRIQKAVKQGALTSDMGEWANQIRIDGNEAVHGEEPLSLPDARRLESFTDLVFRYLFTLPGMMKAARVTDGNDSDSQPNPKGKHASIPDS